MVEAEARAEDAEEKVGHLKGSSVWVYHADLLQRRGGVGEAPLGGEF